MSMENGGFMNRQRKLKRPGEKKFVSMPVHSP
jgi:hypothetical protein